MKRQHVTFLEIPWKEASVSDLYTDFKACDMTLQCKNCDIYRKKDYTQQKKVEVSDYFYT